MVGFLEGGIEIIHAPKPIQYLHPSKYNFQVLSILIGKIKSLGKDSGLGKLRGEGESTKWSVKACPLITF